MAPTTRTSRGLGLLAISTIVAAAASMLAAASPALADDIVIAKKSNASVAETIDRLAAALEAKGVRIFARVDHGAGAKSVDMDLRPSELLIFGSPKLGTPLMQSNPLIGLDLPMKALAWEDDDGTVYLTYTAPAELKDRHNIDDRDEVFAKMEQALDGFTEQAVTGGSDAGASPDTPAPAATAQDR